MSDEQVPVDVKTLTDDQLEGLSDSQIDFVRDMGLRRQNQSLFSKVKTAMKDQEKAVFQALASPPFFYMAPEIEIMPGFKVRLRTLYSLQQDDAMDASAAFIIAARAKGGVSEVVSTVHMSKCFLAHAMEFMNGLPFAGAVLRPEIFDMAIQTPAEAIKVIVDLRTKRMQAIAMIPQPVLQLLIEANQIFQQVIDSITRIGGETPEQMEERAKKIVGASGNSTGPQVAGQKPT